MVVVGCLVGDVRLLLMTFVVLGEEGCECVVWIELLMCELDDFVFELEGVVVW